MTVFTSRFGFKWNYQPHDTGWGTDYNFAHRELAALLHPNVISDTVTTPPGSPAENDAYFVPLVGATGAWSANAGKIAAYQGGAWQYYTPEVGTRMHVVSRSAFYWWNGTALTAEATSGGSSSGVLTVAGHAPDIAGNVALVVADVTGAAPTSSPTLTGVPLAPTASAHNNSTQIATTAYVDSAISALGGLSSVAPGTGINVSVSGGVYTVSINSSVVETVSALATALGSYLPLAGGTLTGDLHLAAPVGSDNTDKAVSSAWVRTYVTSLGYVAGSYLPLAGGTLTGDLHLAAPVGSDNTDKAVSSAWVRTYVTSLGFGTGTGTVTSVGLSMPSRFTVTGTPVTGSGTLAVTENAQAANKLLAGPTTGADAAPTYRSLVAADLPAMPYDISFFAEGVLTASEVVARFVVPRAIALASGASGVAICGTAAITASVVMNLAKNGTNFGTVTYATSATTGTVSITSSTTFAAGDIITWTGPSSANASFADPSLTLTATR